MFANSYLKICLVVDGRRAETKKRPKKIKL